MQVEMGEQGMSLTQSTELNIISACAYHRKKYT